MAKRYAVVLRVLARPVAKFGLAKQLGQGDMVAGGAVFPDKVLPTV